MFLNPPNLYIYTKYNKKNQQKENITRYKQGFQMDFEIISSTFSEGFNFLTSNLKAVFVKMTKIQLLSYGVLSMFLLVAGLVIYLFFAPSFRFGLIPTSTITSIVVAILLALLFIVVMLITSAIRYSGLIYIDGTLAKKSDVPIISTSTSLLFPTLKFSLGYFLLELVIVGPFFAIYMFMIFGSVGASALSGGSGAMGVALLSMIGRLFFQLLYSLVAMVLGFFIQFALYEFFLGNSGVIGSFKKSFSLAKNNFLEVFVFDIAFSLISLMIMIPFVIVLYLFMIFGFLVFMVVAMMGNVLVTALVAILLILIGLVFMIPFGAIIEAWTFTFHTIFWRKLTGRIKTPVMAAPATPVQQ